MVEIDLGEKQNFDPEFVALNPLARVPVLELDDGTCIAESVAICRYFEEEQPEPPLFGTGSVGRATVEMWNRRMEFEVVGNISFAFRHGHPYWKDRIEQVPDFADLCRRTIEERMVWLDGELKGREYIAGDAYTIADITAICGFDLGRVAKIRIPDNMSNLSRWYATVAARPAVAATVPSRKK
jgi:glutathione S-transferase